MTKTALLVLAAAASALAASDIPKPRLARQLPSSAVEAHARQARHNAAMRALLESTGIPTGSDADSLAARTAALELIDAAITNGVELANGSATATAVAAAAADYVRRYAASTNIIVKETVQP